MSNCIIVVICGAYINGLSIARGIRDAGFRGEIYNIGLEKDSICKVSRYTKHIYINDFNQLSNVLINNLGKQDCIKILYYTDEAFLRFIINNKKILEEHGYRFLAPSKEAFDICVSKTLANVFEAPSPKIYNFNKELRFPVYLKLKFSWKNQIKLPRGKIMRNFKELEDYIKFLEHKFRVGEGDYILQEILDLSPENNYSFCCLTKSGSIIKYGVSRKLLQRPIKFGTGCVVELVDDEKVINVLLSYGEEIVKELNFTGVCEIEFIKDKGEFKLIEMNPRFWMQHELFKGININFAAEYYNSCVDKNKLIYDHKTYNSIVWINVLSLIYILLTSSIFLKNIHVLLKLLLRKKIFAAARASDPLPLIKEFIIFSKLMIRRWINHER